MSRNPKISWIFPLLLWSSLQGLALASSPNLDQEAKNQRGTFHPEQENRVTVLVYNYARLPIQTLREAEDRASLIFRKMAVQIEWADCPLNDEDPSLYPKCPTILDVTQLSLRVFAKTATKVDVGGEAFVVRRMPVLRGHHQLKGALQLVDQRQDRVALRHRYGAARQEIVL